MSTTATLTIKQSRLADELDDATLAGIAGGAAPVTRGHVDDSSDWASTQGGAALNLADAGAGTGTGASHGTTSADAHTGGGVSATSTTDLGHGTSVTLDAHATGNAGATANLLGAGAHATGTVGASETFALGHGVTSTEEAALKGDARGTIGVTGASASVAGDAHITVSVAQTQSGDLHNGMTGQQTTTVTAGVDVNAAAVVQTGHYTDKNGVVHDGMAGGVTSYAGAAASVAENLTTSGHGVDIGSTMTITSPGAVGVGMAGSVGYTDGKVTGDLHLGAAIGLVGAGVDLHVGVNAQPIVDAGGVALGALTHAAGTVADGGAHVAGQVADGLHTGAAAVANTGAHVVGQVADGLHGGAAAVANVAAQAGSGLHTGAAAVANTGAHVMGQVADGLHGGAAAVANVAAQVGSGLHTGAAAVANVAGQAAAALSHPSGMAGFFANQANALHPLTAQVTAAAPAQAVSIVGGHVSDLLHGAQGGATALGGHAGQLAQQVGSTLGQAPHVLESGLHKTEVAAGKVGTVLAGGVHAGETIMMGAGAHALSGLQSTASAIQHGGQQAISGVTKVANEVGSAMKQTFSAQTFSSY